MNNTRLQELIKESVNGFLREIDIASEVATLEAKITEANKAIEDRTKKLEQAEQLRESDLINEKKVKQLEKEIQALEKYKTKQESLLEKKRSKNKTEDEAPVDVEVEMPVKEEEEVSEEANITEEAPIDEAPVEEDIFSEMMDEETGELNESFLNMQKMAGLITEAQIDEAKKKAADKKKDKKDDKKKKDDKEEDNGLTAKQKKLPKGMQAAILKRKKKA